jgi:hypothetical protein
MNKPLTAQEAGLVRSLRLLTPDERVRVTNYFCCSCGKDLAQEGGHNNGMPWLDWANRNYCASCSPDPRE